MGWDIYISIEEKINGTWNKINANNMLEIVGSTENMNNLRTFAVMGYDNLPNDLTKKTLNSIDYDDSDIDADKYNLGWINLGNIRIVFWFLF